MKILKKSIVNRIMLQTSLYLVEDNILKKMKVKGNT